MKDIQYYSAATPHPTYSFEDWQHAYAEGLTLKQYDGYIADMIAAEYDREVAKAEARYRREAREQEAEARQRASK